MVFVFSHTGLSDDQSGVCADFGGKAAIGRVPVVSASGEPLMPCKPAKARPRLSHLCLNVGEQQTNSLQGHHFKLISRMRAPDFLPHPPPVEELVCVYCRGELALMDDRYCCVACDASYPIVEGVPMIISTEALGRAVIEDTRWLRHPVEGFDKPARRVLDHKKGYVRFFQETVLRKFSFCGRVLEIGAGSCWASALVKRFNPNCRVYSTDISVQALLKGVEVSHLLGASMDYVVACDAHHLSFKDGLFDVVFGVAVLHHLERPKNAIGEIWRVLKPGGLYIGVREGLAGSAVKPLYYLLGCGWEEERRFGAIERVYTYEEWMEFLSNFEVELTLKRDATLGLSFIERAYYAVANLFPKSMLRHMAAMLEIVARKPVK